jgi:hypothetical protein
MSAHMQSHAHIDAIVTHAISGKCADVFDPHGAQGIHWVHDGTHYTMDARYEDVFTLVTPTEAGQMLFDENKTSVEYRYPDDKYMAVDWKYGDYAPTGLLTLAEIIKAIDGLVYQSCEHPTYYSSSAYALLMALKSKMASKIRGYDDAETWSIHEEDVKRPAFVA